MLIGSGQHQQGAFANPQNGQSPIDADTVRGNDNNLRAVYNSHDASEILHVQSAAIGSRPGATAGNLGGVFVASDTFRAYLSNGATWDEFGYLPLAGGTVTGAVTFDDEVLFDGGVGSHLTFGPDSTYDIGELGDLRPRDLFLGRDLAVAGDADVTGDLTVDGLLATGASTTDGALLNVPHGTAPTAPNDGDMWTTTAGLYVRVNGATVGPLGAGGGGGGDIGGGGTSGRSARFTAADAIGDGVWTDTGSAATALGKITFIATGTGAASANIPHGTAPTAPDNGDIWTTTAGLFIRINGSTVGPLGATAGTVSGSGTDGTFTRFTGTSSVGNASLVETAGAITASKKVVTVASASGAAGFNLPSGSAPSSPSTGDVWADGSGIYYRASGQTLNLTDSGLAPASALYVTLSTNATLTGERVLTAGTGISITDNGAGNTVVISASGGAGITGSGTANYIPKFTGASAIGNSLIQDDGNDLTFGSATTQGMVFTARVKSNLLFLTDNAYDIGASGATRPRHCYVAGNGVYGGNLTVGGTGAFSGKVTLVASASGAASLNAPHGSAPSSPVNGDIWTTTAGVFARINGVTVQLATMEFLAARTFVTVTGEGANLAASRQLAASGANTITDMGAGSTVIVGDGT